MIRDALMTYVSDQDILCLFSNCDDGTNSSSDIDIYCISSGPSSVHMFYDQQHKWVELFIDNVSDVYKKIENIDEIAINFIHELSFVIGNRELYADLRSRTFAAMAQYRLPLLRANLLKYRVKTLLSKYLNPDPRTLPAQQDFILNAISYPLIQLVLEHHHIFPSSPKRWLIQLQKKLPNPTFEMLRSFLAHECERETVIALCDKYAGGVDPVHLEKKGNNNLTVLS